MKDLTEEKLVEIGFKKNNVTPEEAGSEFGYSYFTLELFNGECLLTQSDDECEDDLYFVTFLDMESAGKFWDSHIIVEMVKLLKSGDKS
jgi:hypothetical protein